MLASIINVLATSQGKRFGIEIICIVAILIICLLTRASKE